jgi:hypothetical protein
MSQLSTDLHHHLLASTLPSTHGGWLLLKPHIENFLWSKRPIWSPNATAMSAAHFSLFRVLGVDGASDAKIIVTDAAALYRDP